MRWRGWMVFGVAASLLAGCGDGGPGAGGMDVVDVVEGDVPDASGDAGDVGAGDSTGEDAADGAPEPDATEDALTDAADSADAADDADADAEDSDDAGDDASEPAPTYAEVQAVFNGSCAFGSCHGQAPSQVKNGNLDLREEASYGLLVGVEPALVTAPEGLLRVDPGSPENSLLYLKLELDTGDPVLGGQMPLVVGGKLPDDKIQLIYDWIAAGAPPGE